MTEILTGLVGLLTVAVAFLTYRATRKQKGQEIRLDSIDKGQNYLKDALDRADTERDGQAGQIRALTLQVAELKQEVRSERIECNRRIDVLAAQLVVANISPDPTALRRSL